MYRWRTKYELRESYRVVKGEGTLGEIPAGRPLIPRRGGYQHTLILGGTLGSRQSLQPSGSFNKSEEYTAAAHTAPASQRHSTHTMSLKEQQGCMEAVPPRRCGESAQSANHPELHVHLPSAGSSRRRARRPRGHRCNESKPPRETTTRHPPSQYNVTPPRDPPTLTLGPTGHPPSPLLASTHHHGSRNAREQEGEAGETQEHLGMGKCVRMEPDGERGRQEEK